MTQPAIPSPASRFNRICSIVILIWTLLICGAFFKRPSTQDFHQYRMGGVIARFGEFDSLYPIPNPGSVKNPGGRDDSTMRPRFKELSEQYAEGDSVRFMSPPPNSILLYPLAFGSYSTMHRIWLVIGALCAWRICVQAGKMFALLRGKQCRGAGAIILLAGFSIMTYRSIRVGNVSTQMGWLLGAAALELATRDGIRGAAAITFSSVIKYVGAILAPLVILTGRWKTMVWGAILSFLILAISWAFMGAGPFEIYFKDIWPTLQRSLPDGANSSLEAFLLRISHTNVLPGNLALMLKVMRIGAFLAVLGLLIHRARKGWTTESILAGALALIAWMLIFSPMFWEHYHAYLIPFWGYLIWEATRSRTKLVLVVLAIAMAWVPTPIIGPIYRRLPEPVASHLLWSAVLMWLVALMRLARNSPQAAIRLDDRSSSPSNADASADADKRPARSAASQG